MAKCKQCGADLCEGAKFCVVCGAKVEAEPQKRLCPQCGKEVPEDAVFCPTCGLRLDGQAPAPAVAPAPAPAPQPVYQQPYAAPAPQPQMQPQPFNQNPQPAQPTGPLAFIRCLIANIGVFVIYLLMFLVFVIPIAKGSNIIYFSYIGQLCDFSGATGFSVVYRTMNILIIFLPLIGFLSFGTIALISGIQGLIKKRLPDFAILGYLFGFYAPLFLLSVTSVGYTNDLGGFNFPVFTYSPTFIVFFVALILYLAFGVTNDFFTARLEKKSVAGPIFKASSAVIGVVLFVFIFGATTASTQNPGLSISPMRLYAMSEPLMASGGSSSSVAIFLYIHGLFYIMSVIYCGMAFGEIFSMTRRRVYRVNTIVMTGVSSVISIFSIAAYYSAIGASDFIMGMPSICGFFVLFLAITFLVLSNIAKSKETLITRARPPFPGPRYY